MTIVNPPYSYQEMGVGLWRNKMRRRHYDTGQWRKARKRLRGLPCELCGQPSDTVDHIISIADGGTNDPNNLRPLCRGCNSRLGQSVAVRRRKASRVRPQSQRLQRQPHQRSRPARCRHRHIRRPPMRSQNTATRSRLHTPRPHRRFRVLLPRRPRPHPRSHGTQRTVRHHGLGEGPTSTRRTPPLQPRPNGALMGWTCRRCDNGDHKNCEQEVRGLYCTCTDGQCSTP